MEGALLGLAAGFLIGLASATRPSSGVFFALDGSFPEAAGPGSGWRGLPADLLALVVLGAAMVLSSSIRSGSPLALLVRLPGGLLLVFLGWWMMGAAPNAGSATPGSSAERHPAPHVMAELRDPLWHLFWWSVVFVLASGFVESGVAAGVCFGTGILVGRYVWRVYLTYRASRSRYGRAFTERQYRVFTSLGGLVFVGAGLWAVAAALARTGIRPALERAAARIFS